MQSGFCKLTDLFGYAKIYLLREIYAKIFEVNNMDNYYALADKLWRELIIIPAPSHHEDKRAKYICDTLHSWGEKDAYIDEAKNVILKIDGQLSEAVVFAAHTDIVFPDTEPIPMTEDEKNIYAPGCGDDTASVAILMSVLKYITDSGKKPKNTLLFVFDSCEEGLGNLKGVRALMDKYGNSVREFYTFDGRYDKVGNVSVGSHRYRVTVKTEGGHSYAAFGHLNAANILAKGINAIYDIEVPKTGGKTTYNVGLISGGTSVNTIAQNAEMLCEYRSVSYENLEYMKKRFLDIFDYMRSLGATVEVELVGERPCMKNVDAEKMQKITEFCVDVQKKHSDCDVTLSSSSTDCNIPHSMGIPAIHAGVYMGGGAHTREEWVEKASIKKGVEIVKEIVEHYC